MNSSRGTDTVPQGAAQLGRAGAAVGIAAALTNLLAYLVPLLGARTLGAGDLGALATVMAILAICGVAGVGLQMAVAVARAKNGSVYRLNRLTLMAVAIVVLPLLALTPVLARVLRLPWQAMPLAAVLTAAMVVGSGWVGLLQGSMRFSRLAVGMALLGLARCGGIIAGLVLGLDLVGTLALGAAGAVLIVAAIRPLVPPEQGAAQPVQGLAREVWVAGSATVVLFVLSYADLLAARYLLTDQGSADYAVLNVLTKGAIWAPQVITIMALPYFAKAVKGSRRIAVLGVLGVGAVLILATVLFGRFALLLVGGEAYAHLSGYAPAFAALGALYAVVFVLTNAQVAGGGKRPAAPLWVVAGGFAVAVLVLRPGLDGIITYAIVAAAASVAALAAAVTLFDNG